MKRFRNLVGCSSFFAAKHVARDSGSSSISQLGFEKLEDRNLLASIVADPVTGIVDVYGTSLDDTVLITDNPGTGTFTVKLIPPVPFAPVPPQTLNYSDYDLVNSWGNDGDDFMDNTAFISSNLVGHAGNDTLRGGYLDDTIYGGPGDDTAWGRAGDDIMASQGGKSWFWGFNGNDSMFGDSDVDTFYGGNQNDSIYGAGGNDVLWGGEHDDFIDGNDGDDALHGQGGIDTMYGLNGNDQLWGDSGADKMYGGLGNDGLYGGDGNDLLLGNDGNDDLRGDNDHDVLWGGAGNDYMRGGSGNDVMSGEAGTDNMNGDAGADSINGGGQTTDILAHGETDGSKVVYVNVDGAFLSHADLESWDAGWGLDADFFDPTEDGVTVSALRTDLSAADREILIQDMMVKLLADLDEWGINVQRHHGGAVQNDNATTVFMGNADIPTFADPNVYGIASSIDAGNDNDTDIAFVRDLTVTGGTLAQDTQVLANVLAHEIGHTFGLEHVNSNPDNEFMGLEFNLLLDGEFKNKTYNLRHSSGTQNSWQYLNSIF